MGRSGAAKPAENGNGNGAHPPLTKPSPAATGPLAPITDVRPTAPGHSRQSLASRGSSTLHAQARDRGAQPGRAAQGRSPPPAHRAARSRGARGRSRTSRVLVQQIRNAVVEFLRAESTPLSQIEREEIIEQIVYEVTGLGPIEPLFRDHTITDILVNGPKDVYVERKGKLARVADAASATTRTCWRSSTAS